LYRKTITELLALYEFEPELRHLWVEGSSDVSFFRWFLAERNLDAVEIRPIDQVEVPLTVLEKYGLTPSNRNRAIALSLELESSLNAVDEHALIKVIVDRDFDDFLLRSIDGKFLEYTDFTSIEMYFFEAETIKKIITLATSTPERSVDELMSRIVCVGCKIFFLRAANELLGWNLKMPDHFKLISNKFTSIDFNYDEFKKRILTSNACADSEVAFDAAVLKVRDGQPDEPRLKIRGHDFINLLHWAIKKDIRPKGSSRDAETVANFIFMSADATKLAEFGLFSAVEQHFQ
jgi:hypothetical protein